MSDIKNIVDDSNWSDRTKKNRISFITKLKNELDPNSKGVSFLKDYNLVTNYLLTNYDNPSTRKNKILDVKSILVLIKDEKTIKKYDALVQTLINENDNYKGDNIIKDTERFIPYKDLLELPKIIASDIKYIYNDLFLSNSEIDDLKTKIAKYKYLKLLTSYIIGILYTHEAPVRADYAEFWLDHNFDNKNWFDSKTGIVYFNKFKNVKGFGNQHWKLSNITLNNINHYIRILKHIIDKPSHLLYQIKTNSFQPFTREKFSSNFKKINEKYLHKPLTINDYRHIYETNLINSPGYNDLTINQKKELHLKLLHNWKTSQEYLKVDGPLITIKEFLQK